MATIVTRSGKGSPLTNTEVDANFTNLNSDKLETSAAYTNANAVAAVVASNLDMGSNNITTTGKVLFANVYSALSDLPSASTYHGMFAHVHATGLAYYAHGGAWVPLARSTDVYTHPTGNGNNHIPSNGSSGQILGYASAGTAQWQAAPSSDLVDDTSPQLGGNLDVQAREITTSTSNGNVKITPNGSGVVEVKGAGGNDGTLQLNCSANSHGVKIKSPPHSAGASYTLTLPNTDGSANQVLKTDGSGNLDWAAAGGGADLYTANESSPAAQPSATGANAVAIGDSALAAGSKAVALGQSYAGGTNSFAAGNTTNSASYGAIGANSISIGQASKAYGARSVGIGNNALGHATDSTAVGRGTEATGTSSSAYGYFAISAGSESVALADSYASGANSFAAGMANNSSSYGASGTGAIAMGYQAKATTTNSIAIGGETVASGFDNSICIGWQSNATSSRGAAVIGGRANNSSGDYSVVLGGQGNTASGDHSVAMGDGSTASHNNSVSIGDSVQSTATNQINLGGTADTVRISERYTLPTADGSANQVLTTNGSGVVSFAAAGGGADLYAANPSSATDPVASGTNSVAIGDESTASAGNSFAFGQKSVASGIDSVAMGYQALANSLASVALGSYARGYGSDTVALGRGYASGFGALSAVIGNHTSSYGATGANSIALGNYNKSSGTNSASLGGYNNVSSGNSSFATGYQALASGAYGVAAGFQAQATEPSSYAIGYQANASALYSIAIGNNAKSAVSRQIAFSAGRFAALGDAQGSIFILRSDTTDATAEVLTTNNSTAAADNQIVAASDTCITFSGTITAMQNGAQAYGSWEIKGLLVNDGGTTTLANSAITVISNTSNWGLALSADNTNNALKIQVTGEASHNIRWVANIQTSEVTFA